MPQTKRTNSSRLIGLIDASPPGGMGGVGKWRLVIHLAAWRTPGGAVESGERRCELPVSDRALSRWMQRLSPYQVISLDLKKTTPRATVVRKLLRTNVSDAELEAIAHGLRAPLRLSTKRFGVLTFERRYGWYEGRARWRGQEVRLTLASDDALTTAEALFSRAAQWKRKVDDFAAKRLLKLKNEVWLADGERPLSKAQFLARMKVETIAVSDGGEFTFWFDDGDLFWGHSIQVRGSLKRLDDASIAG